MNGPPRGVMCVTESLTVSVCVSGNTTVNVSGASGGTRGHQRQVYKDLSHFPNPLLDSQADSINLSLPHQLNPMEIRAWLHGSALNASRQIHVRRARAVDEGASPYGCDKNRKREWQRRPTPPRTPLLLNPHLADGGETSRIQRG